MDRPPIQPISAHASVSYRERMSWKVRKEDLEEAFQKEAGKDGHGGLFLYLKSTIPGTHKIVGRNGLPRGWQAPYPGGIVRILKKGISFETEWPKDADLDLILVQAEYNLKTTDGKCTVDIKGKTVRKLGLDCFESFKSLDIIRLVSINTERLYDEDGSFILEADLLVEMKLHEVEKASSKE